MVTHDLMQRGLSFDDAYAAARALRDRIAEREEVSTAELEDLLQEQLESMFGAGVPGTLVAPIPAVPEIEVVTGDSEPIPFSRGLLARSMYAAGVDLDRAYRLVTEVQDSLRKEGLQRLGSDELVRRVGDLLERSEGSGTAARYRVVRSLRRLPKPVVIYLTGASGTGKSTLALDMAPLLRLYRITGTDVIRQVMRMVFSPSILPSVHRSSFEGGDLLDPHLAEDEAHHDTEDGFRRRVIRAYEEQATRILVGVRAVVERSVEENVGMLVEGVHLLPGPVPFQDLAGMSYQTLLALTTLDEEVHRSRFLMRNTARGRSSERYLEHFPAIRIIQEHILHQAENHDVPMVDTTDPERTLQRALRVLTGVLRTRVPQLAYGEAVTAPPIPTLLLIIDGLPDRPVRALGGRTPLQAAKTPCLDRLAREGRCGQADPVAPEVVPDTAAGTLALFGQSPYALKRGPVEAVGAGLRLSPGDVALRANFATLDAQGRVVDRRAGRIREHAEELAEALDALDLPGSQIDEITVRVRSTTEHRLAVVLQGPGLTSAIQGSDPGEGASPGPPLVPRPLDPGDERAVLTARVLALFEQEARRVLARHPVNRKRKKAGLPLANALLSRGAGRIHRLIPLEQAGLPLRVSCISGDRTILGIASWLGAETMITEAMTANLDTDFDEKFGAAHEALKNRDLVVVHLKGADIAAHDRRPDLKVAFLEQADQALARLIKAHKGPLRVAVSADHATLSESGQHAADPVPVLLWGKGVEADGVERFDEVSVATGALHRFPLQLLIPRLFGN
jgi:2,3-bisphosphoglycerate-independent phosphoglycerate mutase